MNRFRVWTRSLQSTSRVRVEGEKNAMWLLQRLSSSFFFKNSEPVRLLTDSSYGFEVSYGSNTSSLPFEQLLARIPEVNLTRDLT